MFIKNLLAQPNGFTLYDCVNLSAQYLMGENRQKISPPAPESLLVLLKIQIEGLRYSDRKLRDFAGEPLVEAVNMSDVRTAEQRVQLDGCLKPLRLILM